MHRTILALLAVAMTASCALGPQPNDVLPSREVPTARASEIVTGSQEGRLARRNGCLYLEREREGRTTRLLVIWPLHTRFDGRFVVPGESTTPIVLRLGERVVIDGSAVDWAPHIFAAYPQLAPWQARCNAAPMFVASIRRS